MIFISMNKHFLLWVSAVLSALMMATSAYAQQSSPSAAASQSAAASRPELADYIVAIVQHEPLTYSQVKANMLFIQQQYEGREMPPQDYLYDAALQQLITQSALAQYAKERGMRIEPEVIQQAITTIARNNGMSLSQLQRKLEDNGIPFSTMRRSVEQQLLIMQLRERTLDATINVSNAEIDAYLAQHSGASDPAQQLINLAQVLIAVPENASDAQERRLQARAQEVYAKAQAMSSPRDFLALVEQYSDDPNKEVSHGVMGARPASRYPELFMNAVQGLQAGGVTPPVRSGAGFHILLVLEREQSNLASVTQTHVRHILLNVTDQQTEQDAINKLLDDKHKIEAGQVAFDVLAREQSQDVSAKDGGDLGWIVPGMFVPEFERVMEQLKPGEISDPVVTRFGVHLIQVLERRDAQLTDQQQRQVARETIHQQKVEQAYEQWAHDIRSQAYIEMREPPAQH